MSLFPVYISFYFCLVDDVHVGKLQTMLLLFAWRCTRVRVVFVCALDDNLSTNTDANMCRRFAEA